MSHLRDTETFDVVEEEEEEEVYRFLPTMSKVFPHSDKKGMDAALDLVEDTLATLRRRVQQEEEEERGKGRKDATTNTTPPPPPSSSTTSKVSKKPKYKSVLIKRKAKYKPKRTRQAQNSSVQDDQGTQREEVAEKVPQDYCKNCNPRNDRKSKTSNTQRKRTSIPSIDPKLADVRERIAWKPAQRNMRQESDSSQDCLCYGDTLCDNPCPLDLREKVMWKPRREASQNTFHNCCLCYSDTCLPLRSGCLQGSYENPGIRKREHSKHSRRDKSDSSCRSNPRKTKSPREAHDTGSRSRERKTERDKCGSSSHRPNRPAPREAQGNDTHTRSRERKMRDADSQGQKQPKKNIDPKAAVDVEKRGYARPTHTSRQRVKCRPKEKENFMPYIPCGAKSHSYHIGITAQQEIGQLLNQPPRDLLHTHFKYSSGQQQDGAVMKGLEGTVRKAMTNIHHHLKSHTH